MQQWTEQDFDRLSWHDCHVHGWGIAAGEDGTATLTLDLDFITAWEQPADGTFVFQVAPATLVFFAVDELAMTVDYASCAVGPFCILGIERTARVHANGYRDFLYRMPVHAPPGGFLRFGGHRFRQTLRHSPIRTRSQCLDPASRAPLFGDSRLS